MDSRIADQLKNAVRQFCLNCMSARDLPAPQQRERIRQCGEYECPFYEVRRVVQEGRPPAPKRLLSRRLIDSRIRLPWSREEDEHLLAWRAEGRSWSWLAYQLRRHPNTVIRRWKRLNPPDTLAELLE